MHCFSDRAEGQLEGSKPVSVRHFSTWYLLYLIVVINLLNSVFHIWWQLREAAVVAPYRRTTVKCKKKSGGCWSHCDACNSWTHAECMSMTADEYQTLKSFPILRHYCDYCFPEITVKATLQCAEKKNNLLSLEKKVEKALQFVEKKVNESEVKILENVRKQQSQDCSTGIRIHNVPEIASQNSAQRLQHDMKHVMAILKHTIGEEPTVSDCLWIGKYDETKRRGIIVKLSNIWTTWKILAISHHMKDYPADYRAFISRELTHEERMIEGNLLKKRRDLIENGTKRTSIKIPNLKLDVDGNEQPANLWQPTYCNLMLINARSVKKPNAVFHLSTDLAAQSIDWCFVTESWLDSDIDDIFISIPNYNLFRSDRSAKNSKTKYWGGVCCMFLCSEQFLMYPDIPSRQWAIRSVVVRNRFFESLCSYLCCLLPTPLRLWQGSVCIIDSGLRTSLPRKKLLAVYYVWWFQWFLHRQCHCWVQLDADQFWTHT